MRHSSCRFAEPGPTLLLTARMGPDSTVHRFAKGHARAASGARDTVTRSARHSDRASQDSFFDQLDLPSAPPALHCVFSCARFTDGLELLEVHQLIDLVLPREAANEASLMLGDPPREVVGDTDI